MSRPMVVGTTPALLFTADGSFRSMPQQLRAWHTDAAQGPSTPSESYFTAASRSWRGWPGGTGSGCGSSTCGWPGAPGDAMNSSDPFGRSGPDGWAMKILANDLVRHFAMI